MADTLLQVGMNGVEIRLQRVDKRNVEPILPDAGRTGRFDSMLVPSAIGREHKIVGTERNLMAINDGVGPGSFHYEAQRRGGMGMRRSDLARIHDLQAGIEPTNSRRDIPPTGIAEIDHTTTRLLRRNEFKRSEYPVPQVRVAPKHGKRLGLRLPRLDLVGNGPKRTDVEPSEFIVIGQELRRIGHICTA